MLIIEHTDLPGYRLNPERLSKAFKESLQWFLREGNDELNGKFKLFLQRINPCTECVLPRSVHIRQVWANNQDTLSVRFNCDKQKVMLSQANLLELKELFRESGLSRLW